LNTWPMIVSAGALAGAGVAAWGAVAPWSQLYGPTLRHTPGENILALTFDDGPNPAVTPRLLDLLEAHRARATFFIVGKFARKCPGLVREIHARGHLLANHTHTHPNLFFKSAAGIREELARCQDAVAEAAGAPPPLWMRPPYGYRNPFLGREIRRMGLRGVVMWSLFGWDWNPQPPERLIRRLARAARPGRARGDIIAMHDGDHRALGADRHHVVAALAHWLPRWRDAGVEFATIEMLPAGSTPPAR